LIFEREDEGFPSGPLLEFSARWVEAALPGGSAWADESTRGERPQSKVPPQPDGHRVERKAILSRVKLQKDHERPGGVSETFGLVVQDERRYGRQVEHLLVVTGTHAVKSAPTASSISTGLSFRGIVIFPRAHRKAEVFPVAAPAVPGKSDPDALDLSRRIAAT
jgi:hypothetical protein